MNDEYCSENTQHTTRASAAKSCGLKIEKSEAEGGGRLLRCLLLFAVPAAVLVEAQAAGSSTSAISGGVEVRGACISSVRSLPTTKSVSAHGDARV